MRVLIDTHVFLWYIDPDPRLPAPFWEAITDPSNQVFLCVVSLWEAVIEHGTGKLLLPGPPFAYLTEQRDRHQINALSIDERALLHLARLPPLHRDPFDRMLVAQALQYDLVMASVDPQVRAYLARHLAVA